MKHETSWNCYRKWWNYKKAFSKTINITHIKLYWLNNNHNKERTYTFVSGTELWNTSILEKSWALSASHLRGIVLCFSRPLCDPIWGRFHPPELLVLFIHQPRWLMLVVQDRNSGAIRPTQRKRSSQATEGLKRRWRKRRMWWIHQHNEIIEIQ